MRLTTYRKTGVSVPTPVWFAQEADRVYVITGANAGKVKRIRHTSRVEVAPCTARGEVLGESLEAQARELTQEEGKRADRALSRKYGLQKFLFDIAGKLSGTKRTYLEIRRS
jgi:hypothetical protein